MTAQEDLASQQKLPAFVGMICPNLPSDCCGHAVLFRPHGTEPREIARVWQQEDAQLIAQLLTASRILGEAGVIYAENRKNIPSNNCDYGIVSATTGKETCRLWSEAYTRLIADLLSKNANVAVAA